MLIGAGESNHLQYVQQHPLLQLIAKNCAFIRERPFSKAVSRDGRILSAMSAFFNARRVAEASAFMWSACDCVADSGSCGVR